MGHGGDVPLPVGYLHRAAGGRGGAAAGVSLPPGRGRGLCPALLRHAPGQRGHLRVYPPDPLPAGGEIHLYHDALPDPGRQDLRRPAHRGQDRPGRADHHAPHSRQVVRPRRHPGALRDAHRGRCAGLRVYAGVHPLQGLPGGRPLRRHRVGEPGLPEPVPPL